MSNAFANLATETMADSSKNVESDPRWNVLRGSIVEHAIHFTDKLNFDFRRLLTLPAAARDAGELMWKMIRPFSPDGVIGPGFGAAPLLFAISQAALREGVELSVLMVRDKRKEHNQKRWIEGSRPSRPQKYILIDDFMESGSAVNLVEQAINAEKLEITILAVAVFFDMWQPLGSRQISLFKHPVLSLFKRHDIGLSRDCFDAVPPLMKGSYPEFIDKELWWRFNLNEKSAYPYKCVPVVADNAVFVADDGCRVWRHDAVTGNIDWCYESITNATKGIVQLLQYADQSVIFACYDGTITRLDALTGNVIWRWRQDSSVHATPTIDLAAKKIYINTEQWNEGDPFGHLQALDWETGKLLWRQAHRYWPPGTCELSKDRNRIVATCNDKTLIAYDTSTGQRLWCTETHGLVRGRPAVHNSAIYVVSETGRAQSFDLETGTKLWETRIGSGEGHQFCYVRDDFLYAFDSKWHMSALNLKTGTIEWLSRLRSAGCWTPISLGRYFVVLSRDGHVAVFDPQKQIKVWEGKISGEFRQPCAVGSVNLGAGKEKPVMAAASNDQGLKLFALNPFYSETDN